MGRFIPAQFLPQDTYWPLQISKIAELLLLVFVLDFALAFLYGDGRLFSHGLDLATRRRREAVRLRWGERGSDYTALRATPRTTVVSIAKWSRRAAGRMTDMEAVNSTKAAQWRRSQMSKWRSAVDLANVGANEARVKSRLSTLPGLFNAYAPARPTLLKLLMSCNTYLSFVIR
jgi:hypothetical protein